MLGQSVRAMTLPADTCVRPAPATRTAEAGGVNGSGSTVPDLDDLQPRPFGECVACPEGGWPTIVGSRKMAKKTRLGGPAASVITVPIGYASAMLYLSAQLQENWPYC